MRTQAEKAEVRSGKDGHEVYSPEGVDFDPVYTVDRTKYKDAGIPIRSREVQTRGLVAWEAAFAEIDIMHRLRGPRVLALYDVEWREPDYSGVVLQMEAADGDVYHDVIQRWDVQLGTKVQLLADLLAALRGLEAKGFVHRAVAPENLLLFGDCSRPRGCRLKLGNFRSACHFEGGLHRCQAKEAKGDWPYVAPEVLRGGDALPGADVYAAGRVFYRMLFKDSFAEPVVQRNLAWLDGSQPQLAALLRRMLAPNPDDRCTSSEAFLEVARYAAANGIPLLADDPRGLEMHAAGKSKVALSSLARWAL